MKKRMTLRIPNPDGYCLELMIPMDYKGIKEARAKTLEVLRDCLLLRTNQFNEGLALVLRGLTKMQRSEERPWDRTRRLPVQVTEDSHE